MMPILTDNRGRPILRPAPEDFPDPIDYIRAVHSFNDKVANMANQAFAQALSKALSR